MTSEREPIEYPDEAGYPDGRGFLDEGTASGEPQAATHTTAAGDADHVAASDDEDDEPDA